jgi:alkylated DNA repair dioxygenase AlkB
MRPVYVEGINEPNLHAAALERLLKEVPWERRTNTRTECFMAPGDPYPYTYGKGRGVRTYMSIPISPLVAGLMDEVNEWLAKEYPTWGPMTGCFLNRYDHDREHLGWHADDFVGMDHTKAVVVRSYGQAREIWWRENGTNGEVPDDCKQLLKSGSTFVMPPGMQHTHQHRIPKGSAAMTPRVSLTFRAFLPL